MSILYTLIVLLIFELLYTFIIHKINTGYSFYTNPKIRLWVYDKKRGYKLAPKLSFSAPTPPIENAPRRIFFQNVQTDKYGFRFDGDIDNLKNHTNLVFCVGDSTTICMESTNDKTWPSLLDKELTPNFRVINAGAGAYRSIHKLKTVEYILQTFKPSDIILHTGINDFQYRTRPGYREFDVNSHSFGKTISPNILHNSLNRNIGLYHLLYSRYLRVLTLLQNKIKQNKEKILKVEDLLYTPGLWMHELETNIIAIKKLCSKFDARLWLILFMAPFYETQDEKILDFADVDLNMNGRWGSLVEMKKILKENFVRIAEENDILTLDIDVTFNDLNLPYQERFQYFVDRFHTSSDKGNPFMANAITENLRRELLLEQEPLQIL